MKNRPICFVQRTSPLDSLCPEDAILLYNLACYECLLGRLEQTKHWLQAAFEIGGAQELKPMALRDPDLEPLWREIGGL